MRTLKCLNLTALAVLALSAAAAPAQSTINGGEVNISGATLFQAFFTAPASTNDWIDVDGDGIFGFDPMRSPIVDQMATQYVPCGVTTWWLVQYRAVGSVNGLNEFVDYHLLGTIPTTTTSFGAINRVQFPVGGCGACNTSGTPECPNSIDMAVLDVPVTMAVRSGSQINAAWSKKPTQDGYGNNPNTSSTGYPNLLASLTRGGNSLNTNTGSPTNKTVFNTQVAWVPIAYVSNRGTGVECLSVSQLKHLYVSGRLPNGENLVGATRSVGSGTRNAAMNSVGVDPSWGRGDNIGNEYIGTTIGNLGSTHQPTNCEGSGEMEQVIRNRRLAVGYTGLGGSARAAGDAKAGLYEIINVKFDDRGGTNCVRPTIGSVLDNCDPQTGYQVGGNETFVTRGNPLQSNSGAPDYMTNQAAADYLNNITSSIAAFVSVPGGDASFNMPGEFLATTFFLLAGVDCLPSPTNPTSFSANAILNQTLQDYIRSNNGLGIGQDTPAYGGINASNFVPIRNTNAGGYSDGSTNGSYTDAFGGNITSSMALSQRNRIQGDFGPNAGGDGQRNLNDIPRLMLAIQNPRTFEANVDWGGSKGTMPHDAVIPEVIGDMNGDGNFDSKDVRYFADGLAIDPNTGKLDRAAGFLAVDNAWATLTGGSDDNYFNTVWANGSTYLPGDSKFDVAGGTNPIPGGPPTGSDGVIDEDDLNYILANFGTWSNLNDAVHIDLSCDVTGDCIVDQADVDLLNSRLAPCCPADANCDGVVDFFDIDPLVTVILNGGGGCNSCTGDVNQDGVIDFFDIDPGVAAILNGACTP